MRQLDRPLLDSSAFDGQSLDGQALREDVSFEPNWLLRNCHVQTLLGMRFGNLTESASQHARVPTFDGDAVDVYFDRELSGAGGAPIVLVAHGMEGNHRSASVRRLRLGARAYGWNSVALEHRSCGRELNRGRRLYHCGDTEDLASVVRWIIERWPGRSLFVAGYSLGGSQLIHYLGSGRHSIPKQLEAAASVSPAFDLSVTASEIDRALGGAYRRYFLRRLIPKALAKARQHPGSLDEARLRAIRSLRDFDEAVTAVLHGFPDADHYYRSGSCAPHLAQVLLAADDDPFSPSRTIPRESCAENPFIRALFTRRGGHCGFVSGNLRAPRHWAEEQVLRFFGSFVGRAGL
jgi:predicted alpha/beta-fold hydrolase